MELFQNTQKKINLKRRAGILIPTEYKNEPFYERIKSDLTRHHKGYNSLETIENRFFLESEKFLTVPRFFPIDNYIPCDVEDATHEGEDILITHNITPRNNIQKRATNYMLQNNNGIMELQPGVGKTVISIMLVAEKKKKTLILVHKEYLVQQWIERFKEFTNLNEHQVIRLKSNNYEKALNAPIIVTTAQTFISLLKRDRMNFLIKMNEANIGIFIADEVHTSVGAPTFAECSIHVPSKIVYGLSATPYRFDGNEDVIEHHMGPIFSEEDDEGTMKANITIVLHDFKVVQGREGYMRWNGKFQRSRYLNMIQKSKETINLFQSLIDKFKDEKNLLFIGERIDKLLRPLFDKTKSNDKGLFISGSTDVDLNKKVVFSTPGKIRDGVDVPIKDCLIMTSPISNIAQICGRVTRTAENKETPVIVDIVDIGCNEIKNTVHKRITYYEKKNWTIQYLIVKNKTPIKIDRSQFNDIIFNGDKAELF